MVISSMYMQYLLQHWLLLIFHMLQVVVEAINCHQLLPK